MSELTEKLKEFEINKGFLPGTRELDRLHKKFNFVPSSRSTQRRHGGIENFYKSLGLTYPNRTKSFVRTKIARRANERSLSCDNDYYQQLTALFGPVAVHQQSPYPGTNFRSDFKVFQKDNEPFYIDIFYPMDMYTFAGCVRIKLKKIPPGLPVILVSMNEEGITERTIKEFIDAKVEPLSENIKIMTCEQSLQYLKTIVV